ncbi:hypothetical protein EIN_323230 [Entamoeba invadens IP1]|uniref:Uncharacterized protein n=1 Tax=Entamoeba invadens IP1 TaxID=370355 RepID=L7FMA6_ENTIV|nr:hypothetical protein EIN_323230 [Entamoeba invadens IP1]ELP88596.1 hypothetical protein EIN_323230 [Entamoeba invadens IP1]|eukprot:XP_004255367.1 hypothetical protein EIN_323230 [Entamoeba invadens IP1]
MTTNKTKIIIFGSLTVGKTTITTQLKLGRFVQPYNPSIEDTFYAKIEVDGYSYILEILDTVDLDIYNTIRDIQVSTADGFLIVYSITDRKSFDEIDYYRNTIYTILNKTHNEHVPIVLCGNKSDLESARIVPIEDGEKIAEEWKVSFFETSAKSRINIDEVFQEVVRDIIKTKSNQKLYGNNKHKKCVLV